MGDIRLRPSALYFSRGKRHSAMNARTGLCAIALLVLPGCITIAQTLPGEIVCDTDGATMKLIPAGGFT
ncbi:MAG TPA: hypothetical protein QGH10_18255, partial [Armatimonadota bacterium]|nr:hypothetical protein [Armatimonadota bacterium]